MRNSSAHIKFLVFTFVFLLSFGSFSQEKKKIDRAWIGFNHGLNRYDEICGHVQMFKNFSFGASYRNFRFPHGPSYSVGTGVFTLTKMQFKDRQNDFSLFAGVTSIANHKSFLSVGVGPSFGKSIEYSNVAIKTSPVTGMRYLSYDLEEYWKFGFSYRAEFNISIANFMGLNFGVVGNFNRTKNYHRFIFGLNFGFLSQGEKKKRELPLPESDRIIIIRN